MASSRRYLIFPILSAIFYVISFSCMRQLAETQVNIFLIVGMREFLTGLAGTTIFSIICVRKHSSLPKLKQLLVFLFTALVVQFCANPIQQYGFGTVGMGITTVSFWAGTLLLTPLIGWFLLHEKMSPRLAVSLALVLIATFLLTFGAEVQDVEVAENATIPSVGASLAVIIVLLSILSGGVIALSNCVVRWVNNAGVSPFFSVMFLPSVGGIGLLGTELIRNGFGSFYQLSAMNYLFVVLAAVTNLIAYISLTIALRYLSAVRVGIVLIMQLTLIPLTGFLVFHEPMNMALLTGIFLVICGIVIASTDAEK